MNRFLCYISIGLATLALTPTAFEAQAMGPPPQYPGDVEQGDPWQQSPYDFVFGNHIDTHIQLKAEVEAGMLVSLKGSFYVIDTGDVYHDTATDTDLPIYHHPRGADHNEVCGTNAITCLVGWHLNAVPGAAKFLYHNGINGDDHPVWMVNRAEEASAPAEGMVIPQPGYYSHFHWITTGSNQDPRAGGVPPACDKANAGQLEDADGLHDPTAVNEVCQGWFLQLDAVRSFAFQHGGEVIPVYPGEDLRTHLNMVTNYNQTPVVSITATRTSEGDDH